MLTIVQSERFRAVQRLQLQSTSSRFLLAGRARAGRLRSKDGQSTRSRASKMGDVVEVDDDGGDDDDDDDDDDGDDDDDDGEEGDNTGGAASSANGDGDGDEQAATEATAEIGREGGGKGSRSRSDSSVAAARNVRGGSLRPMCGAALALSTNDLANTALGHGASQRNPSAAGRRCVYTIRASALHSSMLACRGPTRGCAPQLFRFVRQPFGGAEPAAAAGAPSGKDMRVPSAAAKRLGLTGAGLARDTLLAAAAGTRDATLQPPPHADGPLGNAVAASQPTGAARVLGHHDLSTSCPDPRHTELQMRLQELQELVGRLEAALEAANLRVRAVEGALRESTGGQHALLSLPEDAR